MTSSNKAEFYGYLRDEFAPKLRQAGFRGSSSHFRRVTGDVIHAINIQGNKYGGSVAVNLGIHFTFLPVALSDRLPNPSTIRELDCALRDRLSSKRRGDKWWKFEGAFVSPLRSAEKLSQCYWSYGEPRFERLSTLEGFSCLMLPSDIGKQRHFDFFGYNSNFEAALLMAGINTHLGRAEIARSFAKEGLEIDECPDRYKILFERILHAT